MFYIVHTHIYSKTPSNTFENSFGSTHEFNTIEEAQDYIKGEIEKRSKNNYLTAILAQSSSPYPDLYDYEASEKYYKDFKIIYYSSDVPNRPPYKTQDNIQLFMKMLNNKISTIKIHYFETTKKCINIDFTKWYNELTAEEHYYLNETYIYDFEIKGYNDCYTLIINEKETEKREKEYLRNKNEWLQWKKENIVTT